MQKPLKSPSFGEKNDPMPRNGVMNIRLQDAQRILSEMIRFVEEDGFSEPIEPGKPFSIAIVDSAGVLVAFGRMDGASPSSARTAVNKAFTAIDFRKDTLELRKRLFTGEGPLPADAHRDMAWFGEPRHSPIPGGVLLKDSRGEIVGAIGTSGRTAIEDEELARLGEQIHKSITEGEC
jgi:uncharacterized protein GlcG (DUF336 family)